MADGRQIVALHLEDTDLRGPDYREFSFLDKVRGFIVALGEPVQKALAAISIQWVPAASTNFNTGRGGYRVQGVIIHTTVGTLAATDATFQNPTRNASAHYAVAYDGSMLHNYVKETDTAWHCGRYYPDSTHPFGNVNTIGIEHVDNGAYNSPRPDGLYQASADLVRRICTQYGIPIDRSHIRMHREVSVAITTCPDSLDINRIVALAAGTFGPEPGQITPTIEEEEMIYVGPFHARTGSVTVFAAGKVYRERSVNSPVVANLTVGAKVSVLGYCYVSVPVQSTNVGGGVAGPDYAWWQVANGWVPDAFLDTTGFTPQPSVTIPAGEPMDTLFATRAQVAAIPAGPEGPPGPASTVPGPKGDKGDQGIQGIPGVSPDPAVIEANVLTAVLQRIADAVKKALGL